MFVVTLSPVVLCVWWTIVRALQKNVAFTIPLDRRLQSKGSPFLRWLQVLHWKSLGSVTRRGVVPRATQRRNIALHECIFDPKVCQVIARMLFRLQLNGDNFAVFSLGPCLDNI